MGLISWIKGQYNDYKFRKANGLIESGNTTGAINILEDILECHAEAPQTLLGVYHSLMLKGDKTCVASAANLCGRFGELKADCVKFVRTAKIQSRLLRIDYCQTLFGKGVTVLESDFVNASVSYIRDFSSVSNLKSLSKNTTLLTSLAKALLAEADISYKQKNLSESLRLCELIRPYLKNPEFCELYANVRFDSIASEKITKSTMKELSGVFDFARKNLQKKAIADFSYKGIGFARNLYSSKEYVFSLLVSQHFVDRYSDAKKIYIDSALELYRSSSKEQSFVVPDVLYICLGEGIAFISALEPFLSYSKYREKYISVVENELGKLAQCDRLAAQNLLLRAWTFAPDSRLIKAVFRVGTKEDKRKFVDFIVTSKDILSSQSALTVFVDEIVKIGGVDTFVLETLENLLDQGKDVGVQYEKQILAYSRKAKNRKGSIECIQRAQKRVSTTNLYSAEADYLSDYIEEEKYDSAFALAVAESFVGCHRLAEVLIANILLDDSVKATNDTVKEEKLRKALAFYKIHSKEFDAEAYKQLLPEIEQGVSFLVKKIYPSNKSHAIELLYLLRDNDLSWYDTYAKLYLDSVQKEQESESLATQIFAIISEGRGSNSLQKDELWARFVSVKTHICSKEEGAAISELFDLLNVIDAQCTTANKPEYKKIVIKKLCEYLLLRGKKAEFGKLYGEAISDYEHILKLTEDAKDVKERLFICKLKNGQEIQREDEEQISALLSNRNDRLSQRDLAFRWCIYLLSKGDIKKAESVNSVILDKDFEILQICQDERINSEQKTLDEINEKIQKLNESVLSPEDALNLGRNLSKTLDSIRFIVQVSTQKLTVLKESIRLYAIERFYKEGDALKCLGGLKVQDSTYLSDPIALRNIAIMSLIAAENGQLNKNNYKELLALWATAIYQQCIFVKSLDFTSWDDPYTFSLESALGKLDEVANENLPDNVNYDTPDENHVVSILDVQKSLISRMEKAIEDNPDYLSFFSSQLEAMNLLSSQDLDESCVVVAPYLATISTKYRKEIENALSNEANKHYGNWEEILKVGNLYGMDDGDFLLYSSALKIKESITLAVKNKKSLAMACRAISKVKIFSGLYSEVISAVTTCMNNDIAQEVRYRTFDVNYREAVKAIADDTLTFLFSNFINQQAVKSLNENTETLAQVSPVLFEIYEFSRCNPHLKRNVDNIVEALIHNYITNGDTDNLSVLEQVLSSTREFDPFVIKALKGGDGIPEDMMVLLFHSNKTRFDDLRCRIGRVSTEIQKQFGATATKIVKIEVQLQLSEIVQNVNNNTMNKCDALKQVYDLYKCNKSDAHVCENLAVLISMCVMEYIIPNKIGTAKVKVVLDSLKRNMSRTFLSHNDDIRQAYNMIWNQLPYDARSAIQDSPWELNAQGMALKEGLDYLKALK